MSGTDLRRVGVPEPVWAAVFGASFLGESIGANVSSATSRATSLRVCYAIPEADSVWFVPGYGGRCARDDGVPG